MPIFCKADDHAVQARPALTPDQAMLKTDVCQLHRITLAPRTTLEYQVGPDDLVWIFVLSGNGAVGDQPINATSVVVAGPNSRIALLADDALQLIWPSCQTPRSLTQISPLAFAL